MLRQRKESSPRSNNSTTADPLPGTKTHFELSNNDDNDNNMATSQALLDPKTGRAQDVELGEGSPLVLNAPTTTATTTLPAGDAFVDEPDEELAPIPEGATIKEKIVAGAAAISFTTNIISMLWNAMNPFALVSGFIGAALAPYAAFQQQKLTQTQALAETNERFTEEVDQLKGENVRLKEQLVQLEASIAHLKELESKLAMLQAVQGQSLEELEDQLQESHKIYEGMQKNLQGDILQNLISMVLACDNDGDMVLSDDEIDELIQGLEGVHGVQLKEDLIRQKIVENGRSLNAIMDVARDLFSKDPNQEHLFSFVESQ